MAPRRKVVGKQFKSLKDMKKALGSRSGGGNPDIKIIQADEQIMVRFLTEPGEGWCSYNEHYDSGNKRFVPCTDGDCCRSLGRASQRYLANAYVLDESKVMAVKMTASLVEQLLNRHEKYGTILDRDYELSRTGSGLKDTVYMVSPEPPSKMNLRRYNLLDLEAILESLANDADDDEDDEDERPRRSKSRYEDDEDDDYEDDNGDEDEDEEDEPPRRSRRAPAKKTAAKRTISRRR